MIITIDGPVATGKSTIAKKLAEAIGFIFFDTGAMYRAVAYGILNNQLDLNDQEQIQDYLNRFRFDVKILRRERHYFVDGEDVTNKLRGEEVTSIVSAISALKIVRDHLVAIQRQLAIGVNAVFEGRDMGSVVFPEAAIKIFLTGRNEVRAKRRHAELLTKFPEETKQLTLEKCLEEINRRDTYDSTRENSPLIQAKDAYVIDTSDLTIEEVVYKILEYKDSIKTHGKAIPETFA